MRKMLGISGFLGLLCMLAGIVAIASQNPIIGGGVALVIAGLGLFVRALVSGLMGMMGMGGMM
jgi:hypothetical protein